jgi:hypothetical protein
MRARAEPKVGVDPSTCERDDHRYAVQAFREGPSRRRGARPVACCFATAIDLGSGWPIEYH